MAKAGGGSTARTRQPMTVDYVEVECPDLVGRLARVYGIFWEAGVRDGLVVAQTSGEILEEGAA